MSTFANIANIGAERNVAEDEKGSLSDEEMQKMEQFITYLQSLQVNDPAEFKTLLSSMGVNDSPSNPHTASSIIQAIADFRKSGNNLPDINLPNSTSQLGSDGLKQKQKSIQIKPEPGFSIKTRRVDDQIKIAEPHMKKKLDDNGEEVEGMNIPLSVGPMRKGVDKSDVPCCIYDIIVNPKVLEDIKTDETGRHKDFICQLALQSLRQKYNENLDTRYKLPKGLRYTHGLAEEEVAIQYIQDRKGQPKIEEVASSSSTAKSGKGSGTGGVRRGQEDTDGSREEAAPDRALSYSLEWCDDEGDVAPVVLPDTSYVEPTVVPETGVHFIRFRANIESLRTPSASDISVNISAYKLQVKISKYIQVAIGLPCVVLPAGRRTSSTIERLEGYARQYQLTVMLEIDKADPSMGPDPGSTPWLIGEALKSDEDDSGRSKSIAAKENTPSSSNDDSLPEDKFHPKLPPNVDKYTGVQYEDEERALPEDRFHRKDAQSAYLLDQRERERKEKIERHEKEKAERIDDPNVEYIEVEDFKRGGKYGPKDADEASKAPVLHSAHQTAELEKASLVLASALNLSASLQSEVLMSGEGQGQGAEESGGIQLNSNLWTQLLD